MQLETPPSRIRVVIVDDHALVRSGLETILAFFNDIELVAQADSGAEAIRLCEEAQPDVVLMDLVMPGMNGAAATREILRRCPTTRVLVLTSFSEEALIESALNAGAIGYLMKNISGEQLAAAIREASLGKSTLAPEAAEVLIHRVAEPGLLGDDLATRERQVLSLLADGLTNTEIAERLVVSLSTVESRVSSIIIKFGAASRADAAVIAERHRLVQTMRIPRETQAAHVSSLIRRPPVFVDPDSSIRDAVRVMREELVRAVLVLTPSGLGIVTEGDLRDRALVAGLPLDAPVSAIMTSPVKTMRGDQLAAEAAIEMLNARINHLPVVDARGSVLGVVSSFSLMRLDALSPFALAWSISRATTVAEVVTLAQRVPEVFLTLVDANLEARDISRVLTVQNDTAVTRLLQLAIERHGPPPVPFAWLTLGSVARWETTLASDQDNALAYADTDDPDVDSYFETVAMEVNDGLARCGYALDISDVLARNKLWRKSLSQWNAVFADCLEHPDHSNLVRAALTFDFRQVSGELDVVRPLVEVLLRAPQRPGFLARLARTVTDVRSPLGFRQRLIGPVDLKKSAALPIENLARFHGLSNRVTMPGTLDRLAAIEGLGALTGETAKSLQEAFIIILNVRLQHHAAAIAEGRTPDNVVDTDRLPPLARLDLQAALRAVAAAQRQMAHYVPLGM